jgi:hypothetical protein
MALGGVHGDGGGGTVYVLYLALGGWWLVALE